MRDCLIEVQLGSIGQPHLKGRLSLLDLLDHGSQSMVVNPGVVQVAAAARPVKETDDKARIIGRAWIKSILLFEDLQRAGLQRALVPVIERPLVYPLVFRILALLNGIVFFHPIDVPFRIRVDAIDGAGHAAHKAVVVDVELFPLQQGGHELGATHDILVALSVRVNLLHDPDPLEIDLRFGAPELFFQSVDTCLVGFYLSCGTFFCFLFLFHFTFSFRF